MTIKIRLLVLSFALLSAPAWSATYWVGSSAACTGSNVHPNLSSALLSAAFNGTESDEIRLTGTVAYTGANGDVTLTDWSPASAGSLTLAGGYPDCFTSPSGRTVFGNTSGVAVTVGTSSQSQSNVTLRRLDIRGADTGLSATGGASVILDNVRIGGHSLRGLYVDGGAYVDVQADSVVEDNGDRWAAGTSWGGGLYCNGSGSEVTLRGQLHRNSANIGGSAYLANGCFMMLMGGATVSSDGIGGPGADEGGGVYVDNGGELYANGGSQRVTFTGNFANNGGGLYVTGTGRATLVNVFLQNNAAYVGAAIYAVDGGTSTEQLTMDRATSCPFLISCSEMEGNRTESSVVYVDNSRVRISRTLIETTWTWTIVPDFQSIVHGTNGALVRLGHVGMYNNNATDTVIWNEGAQFEIQHATIARNQTYVDGGTPQPSRALLSQGSLSASYLHNSIIADSTGVDLQGGSIQSACNLADSHPGDLPAGTFYVATPQFINIAGGDARQTSSSPGVDMCLSNPLLWSSSLDIERQTTGVNNAVNDQGSPGESGGYFDAGFDENHLDTGPDYFTLTAAKSGTGTGSIISVPLGIACGSDCEEDFFNGTLVELYANGSGGSTFNGWIGCPLPSGNVCYISVTTNATVTATFNQGGAEIFSDRFESAP